MVSWWGPLGGGDFCLPIFPISPVFINGFCRTQEPAFNREKSQTLLQDGENPGLAEASEKDLWGLW